MEPEENAGLPVAGPPVGAGLGAEELAAVRDLARRAHPDAVAELIGGGSVAEVMASVEPARAAYQRIAAAITAAPTPASVAASVPAVPAGALPALAVDVEGLPTTEKIRRGLAGRGGR